MDAETLLAIAMTRCLTPGNRAGRKSHKQCMCDAGIKSSCSQVNGSYLTKLNNSPTEQKTADPIDDLNKLFEDLHNEVGRPDLKSTIFREPNSRQADGGLWLLLILLVLICTVYALVQCTCERSRRSQADESDSVSLLHISDR